MTEKLISAITAALPQLTKQQLSEILLLTNAWSNGIPLMNLKVQPIGVQENEIALKNERILNGEKEMKIYKLHEKIAELTDHNRSLGDSLKQVLRENRGLKTWRYLPPGQKLEMNIHGTA